MSGTIDPGRLQAFYCDYMEVLDDERLEEWPNFFTADGLYQLIPRENYDSGLQLCTIQADGKAMIVDRVQGIRKTQRYAPQHCRRFYSGLKATAAGDNLIRARHNVLVIQTLIDQPSRVILCGAAYDQLCSQDGKLLIKQRIVVSDTEIIDNALIWPV